MAGRGLATLTPLEAHTMNDSSSPPTVAELVDQYLKLGIENLAPDNQKLIRQVLREFKKDLGHLTADQLRPIDFLSWQKSHAEWRSEWTLKRNLQLVKRVFNWCQEMGLIEKNPLKFARQATGEPGTPMTDGEFLALVRASDGPFKRFLWMLWWTGARPGELAAARWCDVDWEHGRIVLRRSHKTYHKTRKPRAIYLPPVGQRLLAWMERNRPHRLLAALYDILKDGPLPVAEVMERLKPMRPPASAIANARELLHIEARKRGNQHAGSYWVYELVGKWRPRVDDAAPIFVSRRGNPWKKNTWTLRMRRLRQKTGVTARLYGTRHAFAHRCIRNNVSLKHASLLLGHVNTTMIERHYLSTLGDDVDQLRAAAQQAMNGKPGKGGVA